MAMQMMKKASMAVQSLTSQATKMQSTMDDKKVLQQILATHSTDAGVDVDIDTLLCIVEDILQNATPTAIVNPKIHSEILEDKPHHVGVSETLAFTIHKIGCEMSCNCSGEGDVKATTLAVFSTLAKYSWEAKAVMALSAFAMTYGEFCLITQLHTTNPLARSVVLLKFLPDISERESLLNDLLGQVLAVTKCIIELMELPSQYISRETWPLSDAITYIPNAVYWTIKSVVACASQSIGLVNMGHEYVTSITEARKKLSDLSQAIKTIHEHLTKQLVLCRQHIEEKKQNEVYYNLIHIIETVHKDNMEILKALIHSKDDLPLFNGVDKKRVSLDVLKGKTVILFISYFDISDEEIKDLIQMNKKPERQYAVVWLPIINRSVDLIVAKNDILRKASLMPWYSLHHSVLLEPAVIRYFKEVWHLEQKPFLVVLDGQGKIVCPNAFHMMCVWGSDAFPFDTQREETLWKEVTWSIEFLVDEIFMDKQQLVKEGKFICLYGGEDIDWIKKFVVSMKDLAKKVGTNLEMIYIGKKNKEIITKENLSKCLDIVKIRQFRLRLESIWYSKMKHGQSIENDAILKDVMMLLSSDGSGQGWAVIGHGSTDIVTANGKIIMDSLSKLHELKANIKIESFITTWKGVIKELQNEINDREIVHNHCNHLILPSTTGIIQENVVCVDCKSPMEKYVMYRCCKE